MCVCVFVLLRAGQVTVMQKQLLLLHNASTGLFTGDIDVLERCLKAYHIRLQDGPVSLPGRSEVKSALREVLVDMAGTPTSPLQE